MENQEVLTQICEMFTEIESPESLRGRDEEWKAMIKDIVSDAREEAIKQIMVIVEHMKLVCKNTSTIINLIAKAKAGYGDKAMTFRGLPWAWCYEYSEDMKLHIMHFLVEGNPSGNTVTLRAE